ncbi:MAG: hypothetical protein EHM59_18545 [Betaproteobacteria bacterium]|nr:MAG: hypothetical protein EHM59_18545 [Betaproteobacteria bacterium]
MARNQTTRVFAGGAHYTTRAGEKYRGGLFRRSPGDAQWESLTAGLPDQVEARVIRLHPGKRDVVYAGTQDGPYRSLDGGNRWERLGFPERGAVIWTLEFHPGRPEVMYAGTAPFALYRSLDGGDTWRKLEGAVSPEHCPMDFPTRAIGLAANPAKPDELYAALEVSGVIRSADGGETWADLSAPLIDLADKPQLKSRIGGSTDAEGMLDSHAIVMSAAHPDRVILAVRMGLFRSDDQGRHWTDMEVGRFSPLTYCRAVVVSPHDPRTLYAGLSPASRSTDGSLYRSDDLGSTWRRYDRGIKANATMMAISVHPADPNQVYCVSRCGQVFGTADGGETWHEWPLPKGVEDVYAVACG